MQMSLSKYFRVSLLPLMMSVVACAETVPQNHIQTPQTKTLTVYLTGYSWWDNTPPGSSAIARPVLHNKADGSGTYNDPITLAVGHSIERGKQTLDYPAGTRFYFPKIRKYAIVEDVCGDGPQPQNGPCHSGKNGAPWVDIWVGGKSSKSASNACMYKITGMQTAYINPPSNFPVIPGPLTETGCPVF
jgi:hypothetical protein